MMRSPLQDPHFQNPGLRVTMKCAQEVRTSGSGPVEHVDDKGKPVERRGRKAMGPPKGPPGYRITELPMNSHTFARHPAGRAARGAAPSRWIALAVGAALSVVLAAGGAAPMAQAAPARGSAPAVAVPAHSSTEFGTYVTAVYQDLFGRATDPSGLQTWTAALTSGTPRVSVANSITSSAEYRSGLIRGAYTDFLGRAPEPSGLASWLTEMGAGMTIQRMEGGFVASQEYYNRAGATSAGWVKRLYQHVLRRDAGAAEVQHWVDQLALGASREAVARGFLISAERLSTVIDGYYRLLLGRGIDPSGRQTWVTAIQQGARTEAIIGAIVASDEYVAANGGVPTVTATPTPTPTPTTSPTASAAGFPSASNTGVPAGVTLTPYTGPERITQPGTVIDSKLITTPLVIAAGANDVTIRNSLIRANGYWLVLNDEGATNLQITDTELDGAGNPNGDAAVGGRNYTLTRVNIHSTVDGLKLGDNVTVQDSYIHDLVMTDGSHNDGMQSLGSNNLKILHNTVIVADGSTSAIILSTGSADSMRNIRIENNLLGGGAYTVYGGYQAGTDDLSRVSDVVISNNRITTSVFPNGGAFGPFTSNNKPAVTITGNVWHDGPNAGRSI